MQVYMTKKPELEEYHVDLSKYDNIIIGSLVGLELMPHQFIHSY